MRKITGKYVRTFSPDNAPAFHVKPHEKITILAEDTAGGQIRTPNDTFESIDWDLMNPCTGPITIDGAEPGDILVANIHEIHLPKSGFSATFKAFGILRPQRPTSSSTKFAKIQDGLIHFSEQIAFLPKPHCGIIGIAPQSGSIPVVLAGDHGGNMDHSLIGPGSRVYFPVNVPGGLFQIGDVHAAMGDGEAFGSPVEIKAEVEVSFEVIKRSSTRIKSPVVETDAYWSTTGWHCGDPEDILAAIQMAAERMLSLIQESWGLDEADAMMLMSNVCDLQLGAACLGDHFISAKAVIPKLTGMPALITVA